MKAVVRKPHSKANGNEGETVARYGRSQRLGSADKSAARPSGKGNKRERERYQPHKKDHAKHQWLTADAEQRGQPLFQDVDRRNHAKGVYERREYKHYHQRRYVSAFCQRAHAGVPLLQAVKLTGGRA